MPENVLNNATTPGGEGDGVALESTRHPYLITDEMFAAGMDAFGATIRIVDWKTNILPTDMLQAVYTAMRDAEPPDEEEIDEDSLETMPVEWYLPDEVVERFAIQAAPGNNGDAWAAHYTEEQKEHWRKFVREFGAELNGAYLLRLANEEKT